MNIWGNEDGRLASRSIYRSVGRLVGDLADRGGVELAILRNEAGKERERGVEGWRRRK